MFYFSSVKFSSIYYTELHWITLAHGYHRGILANNLDWLESGVFPHNFPLTKCEKDEVVVYYFRCIINVDISKKFPRQRGLDLWYTSTTSEFSPWKWYLDTRCPYFYDICLAKKMNMLNWKYLLFVCVFCCKMSQVTSTLSSWDQLITLIRKWGFPHPQYPLANLMKIVHHFKCVINVDISKKFPWQSGLDL